MSTELLNFATAYTFYSGCITFSLGILGNFLNIAVFTHLKQLRTNRCVFYLTVESTGNFIYQFLSMTLTILTSIYGDDGTGRSSIWCKLRYIIAQILGLTEFYILSLAAMDQYFSTHYQFNLRQMCTFKMARNLTVICVCFWVVHSIIFASFFDVQPSFGCVISNLIILRYYTYVFYPVLAGLLPVFIASVFGLLAFRNVRRIVRRQLPIVRRRLDRQMTAMVLIRVIVYACLAVPYTIFRTYVVNFPIPRTRPYEFAIGRLVQAVLLSFTNLNYMVSFYVYITFSSRYRHQVKYVLAKKFWHRCKRCCCFKDNQITPEHRESSDAQMELDDNH